MNNNYVSDAPINDVPVFLITFTPRSNFNTFVQMAFVQGKSTFYYRTFWNKGDSAKWDAIDYSNYFKFLPESVTVAIYSG